MKKYVVIKCGGSLLTRLSVQFFENIKNFQTNGYAVILVHGGGPEIDTYGEKLNLVPKKIDGVRVTDDATMNVVSMVLNGLVNKRLVSQLLQRGFSAIGLSGVDDGLLQATSLNKETYGNVGVVKSVKEELLKKCSEQSVVVLSPVGVDEDYQIVNINGDIAAGAVAYHLQAEMLILATDVDGIMENGVVIKEITEEQIKELMKNKVITGGMIPKVQSACDALTFGVQMVCITNGSKQFLSKDGSVRGTMIAKESDSFEKFVIS
ncbi:MAG: acetylglutamate kinase [Bacillaceae bacterium]